MRQANRARSEGKKPALTGKALALTRGEGKKIGLKKKMQPRWTSSRLGPGSPTPSDL